MMIFQCVQACIVQSGNEGISLLFLPLATNKTSFFAARGLCNQENSLIFYQFVSVACCV